MVFTLISYLLVKTHSASCLFTHSMIYLTLQSWPQRTVSTTNSSHTTGLGASHDCEYILGLTDYNWVRDLTVLMHLGRN
jgi:hypothetical protein